jgi:prepilin-type N-terminal cleavage/methylation domain-containing protein
MGHEGKNEMRKQKGFSLIELLIVVAIILIIAAIAIPNLLRARIAANESSAAAGVRTINTAEVAYNSNYPSQGYSPTLKALGDPANTCPGTAPILTNACLLDNVLAQDPATKSGFLYTYIAGAGVNGVTNASYTVSADPLAPGQTGVRSFCSFADAVVRFTPSTALAGACPVATAPLQ